MSTPLISAPSAAAIGETDEPSNGVGGIGSMIHPSLIPDKWIGQALHTNSWPGPAGTVGRLETGVDPSDR